MIVTRIRSRLRDEAGIAMVVVILAVMVVTILGASLFVSSIRDLDSSTSVQRASTALGIAEAGVQRAILMLKTVGPTRPEVTELVNDESCTPTPAVPACDDTTTPGKGKWIHPSVPAVPPRHEHFVGNAGTGLYRVYVQAQTAPIELPSVKESTYKIVATGFDRRDRPTRPGERTVEQFVRVKVHDLPFGLFSKNNVEFNGNPKLLDESLWAEGSVKWRSKISFSPSSDPACLYAQGCDMFYGWNSDSGKCDQSPSGANKCPNAVHATGTIYRGNESGTPTEHGPIHPPVANCDFPYDRDQNGGNYGSWPCSVTAPPYPSSKFTSQDFPFDTRGPLEDTYQFFKQMAQSTGTFCTHSAKSNLVIQGNGTGSCPIDKNKIAPGFFVLYVEATSGAGDVEVKFGWGPQSTNPENVACDPNGSFGVVIVRNANLDWQNSETWWGAIFVPNNTFFGSGTGTGGWIIGTIYASNITWKGNTKVQLNECWVDDLAGPWFAVSRLRWHESDR